MKTRTFVSLSTALIAVSASTGIAQAPVSADARVASVAEATSATASADIAVPFGVGEHATYDVKFGAIHVGTANTLVKGIEQVRGRAAWHTVLQIKGGTFFYKVNDVFESWIDKETFSSLRFYQTQEEGSKDRKKRYEIFPDSAKYVEMDKNPPKTSPGVKDPLDDGSFLFFVRTLPMKVGETYESNRYFRPDRNPVRVKVLRKETIEVPAGKFSCIVLQPVIKTKGIFSENGNAEVWVTDDARHIVVQLKSKLSIGSINLYLKSYKAGAGS